MNLWFNKGKDKGTYILLGVIMYILVAFVTLHTAALVREGEGAFNAILGAMSHITSSPLSFLPLTVVSFKYLGIVTGVFVIAVIYITAESEKNKRDAINQENGSAHFQSASDKKKYKEQFMSPHEKLTFKKKISRIFVPKKPDNKNIILTNDIMLSLNARKTNLNLNVLVIGGSGSGKSRFYVKPNLLQANTSFVVTDPAGELLETMGIYLEEQGYNVQVFNLIKMQHSCCYNPFAYIRDTEGVPMLVNCLIKNTTSAGAKSGDDFWVKSETALLCSLISYLIESFPGRMDKCNFTEIMNLLRDAEVDENNPGKKSTLDRKMEKLERDMPNSMAVKDYKTFKMGAGKTLKSILISCAVRLHPFDSPGVASLVRTDIQHPENNLQLEKLGDEKTALFIIIPSADDTYNFIAAMMYYQLFESLYFRAENIMPKAFVIRSDKGENLTVREDEDDAARLIEHWKRSSVKKNKKGLYTVVTNINGKQKTLYKTTFEHTAKEIQKKYRNASYKKGVDCLPSSGKTLAVHVHFLMDEFANVGQVPDFDKKLSTMRKYEISCSIILQNMAQLEKLYDKDAKTLAGQCDETLFLGSSEPETCKYISDKLGDATITVRNASRSLGSGGKKGGGANYNFSKSARKLLTPDEVSLVQKDCILFIRGQRPFFCKKYNYPKHPNYKMTGDADSSRIFYCTERFNNKLDIQGTTPVGNADEAVAAEYKANPQSSQQAATAVLEEVEMPTASANATKTNIERMSINSESMEELLEIFEAGNSSINNSLHKKESGRDRYGRIKKETEKPLQNKKPRAGAQINKVNPVSSVEYEEDDTAEENEDAS